MRILCVAEKPSIANSITGILSCGGHVDRENGRDKYCKNNHFQYKLPPNHTVRINARPVPPGMIDVTVTSVRGHVMSCDFGEAYKSWRSCPPADLFKAPIEINVTDDAKHIATNLKQQTRNADLLMIWTDCDREGEHIGSEIVNICRSTKRTLPVLRAKFSAIIAEQIHRAMQNPIELDWNAVAAVDCRQELDLRLGVAFTRLQTVRLQNKFNELDKLVISYGPCQFPTLGFVVEQYCKVMEFVPEPFWYIAVMKKRNDVEVDFRWSRNHLFKEEDVTAIFQRCIASPEATVTKVTTKDTRKFKPSPLTTVELQKAGGRLLRMAPKKVLDIAEKLYQRGILSYPRTESDQYDPAFDFNTYIDKQKHHPDWGTFASNLVNDPRCFEKPVNGKKNDKAHPPIHPTKPAIDLTGDEKRVYDFVTRRFLASCSKHAVGKQTNIDLNIAAEIFSTNGIIVLERNYLDVYPFDTWGGPALPEFRQGERFTPDKIEKKEGETTRPKLLTEADLVSLMDKNGIGTDATIAEHIQKIIDRQYVMLMPEGQIKYLVPSTLGMGLVSGYNKIVDREEKSLCKPKLRRETEENMGLICEGTRTKDEIVRESLEEYFGVFQDVENHFNRLEDCMNNYLRGPLDEAAQAEASSTSELQARPEQEHRSETFNINAVNVGQQNSHTNGLGRSNGAGMGRSNDTGAGSSNGAREGRSNGTRRTFESASDDLAENKPLCRCNQEATQKAVVKDGPNKGRLFWSCAKIQNDPGNCQFFQFADQNPVENGGIRSSNNYGASSSTSRAGANSSSSSRRCLCGQEAKQLTVTKEGSNKGRKFWSCPNMDRSAKCDYFEWDEDEGGSGNAGESSDGRSCYNCGRTGHWSAQCPQNKKRGNSGHSAARPSKRGTNKSSSTSRGSCYNCGEEGHWSNDCP
ncbi:putative DNA topoisomerase type I, partial [Meira miltonrushii]